MQRSPTDPAVKRLILTRADIARKLIAELTAKVEAAEAGDTWGHAGDLGHINAKLRELITGECA